MNILVTGGTGFVGSAITYDLLKKDHKVFVTGRELVQQGAILLNIHLTGLDWTWLKKQNIEAVYHQAANNDTQSTDEDDMLQANYFAPCYMFNTLYRFGCRKFIYASSTAVYGNSPAPYIENETTISPLTYYGKSKAMFDEFAMNFAKERKDASVIGLRYCNVYGHGEQQKQKRASMIYQLLACFYAGETPSLFEFGEQKRDWIYIEDVVKANCLALDCNVSDVYNCASGKSTSFNRLVEIINEIKYTDWSVNYIKNFIADTYQTDTCCNISKIQNDLKFSVDYPIELGLAEMIKHFDFWNQTHD